MRARTTRSPLYAAGVTAILAAALAGCAAAGSGTAATGSGTKSAASASPLDAVKLAAKTTGGASSFTGTISVQATARSGASGGDVSLNATMAEQLHPLLAEMQFESISAAGQTLPGEMAEVITPSNVYLKWSVLTQELHTSKPWLVIPVSALSKSSGIDLSQLFSQATNSSPLNTSQLLAGASGVRKVGTTAIGGVPVTEYTGTVSLVKGMQFLAGSAKASMEKQVAAAGLTTGTFKVWVDGQSIMRKLVMTENGTALTEVVTVTVTSLDKPVNIQIPAAGQTTAMPSSALGS